jgi:hypothetical protein
MSAMPRRSGSTNGMKRVPASVILTDRASVVTRQRHAGEVNCRGNRRLAAGRIVDAVVDGFAKSGSRGASGSVRGRLSPGRGAQYRI